MYGAGHPPLPSVEIATFSEAMPRHWQYLKEKKPEVQKMLHVDAGEAAFEQTKLVAVSSVVVLREELNLLASQAALAIPEMDPKVIWPELAQFDCASCHHELLKPVWRPRPGAAAQPGRPPLRRWPTALAELVLDQRDGPDKTAWRPQLQAIAQALESRPFGRPAEVAAAARQAVAWLDQRLPVAVAAKYDRAAALHLLHRLGSFTAAERPDYDSARQRAWAFRIIYQEFADAPGPKPANHQAIRQLLQILEQELYLKLPAGRNQRLEEQLPAGLIKRADFGPAQFMQTFDKLQKLLPEK
jgi:hypothetical protein